MIMALLLIAHLFGDFIFQSSSLAVGKQKDKRALFTHALIYTICISIVSFLSLPLSSAVIVIFLISVTHLAFDSLKVWSLKHTSSRDEFKFYIIDQILHIIVIVFTGVIIQRFKIEPTSILKLLINESSYKTVHNLIILALEYCICLNPSAIFIKKMFEKLKLYHKGNTEIIETSNQENAGYAIGILERLIIITLGIAGQLGTIGFVLAAKSLARFNQLSDRDFAEKYLIGTLSSTLIALICVLVGKVFLI